MCTPPWYGDSFLQCDHSSEKKANGAHRVVCSLNSVLDKPELYINFNWFLLVLLEDRRIDDVKTFYFV